MSYPLRCKRFRLCLPSVFERMPSLHGEETGVSAWMVPSDDHRSRTSNTLEISFTLLLQDLTFLLESAVWM